MLLTAADLSPRFHPLCVCVCVCFCAHACSGYIASVSHGAPAGAYSGCRASISFHLMRNVLSQSFSDNHLLLPHSKLLNPPTCCTVASKSSDGGNDGCADQEKLVREASWRLLQPLRSRKSWLLGQQHQRRNKTLESVQMGGEVLWSEEPKFEH